MTNQERERDIAILMNDHCTRKEAERHLKDGTVICYDGEEMCDSLGKEFCQCLEAEFSVDRDGLIKILEAGEVGCVDLVKYEGHTYLVDYVL